MAPLFTVLATLVCAVSAQSSLTTTPVQLTSEIVADVNYVQVLDDASAKLSYAESVIEQVEGSLPEAVTDEQAVVAGAPLNTEAVFVEHNYPSLETALQTLLSDEASISDLASVQQSIEQAEQSISSLFTKVSQYMQVEDSSFVQATGELRAAAATYPSATTLVSYVEAVELSSPSIVKAESVVESIKESSPLLLSYVNLVRSQPSALTDPSYFDSVEDKYPSLFDALGELSVAFLAHSTFSTVMSTCERLETSIPSFITEMEVVQRVVSPSTAQMITEIEYLEDKYSSLDSYIQLLTSSESSQHGPALGMTIAGYSYQPAPEVSVEAESSAQNVLQSIEQMHPSISTLLSEMATFSNDVHLQAQTMPAKKCSSMQVDVEVFS